LLGKESLPPFDKKRRGEKLDLQLKGFFGRKKKWKKKKKKHGEKNFLHQGKRKGTR